MAIIIDIGKFLHGEKPEAVDITGAEAAPPPNAPPRTTVEMVRADGFNACLHRSMQIDDKQRTVKCGTCGIWLDPVWCLRELFHYYETRHDHRIERIEAWEQKQKEIAERKEKRRQRPRTALIERRAESAERAAYNEYQAKILSARADRQRQLVAKLDNLIDTSPVPTSGTKEP